MHDPATTWLRAMAHNNAWANHRLLRACAGLTPEAFAAPRTSFFPSLPATLNHILIVDWYYVDALEGGTLGPAAFASELPCPALADLSREQRAVDRRLIAVCANLTADRLAGPVAMIRARGVVTDRVDRVLLHLFQHQLHHRGQAHAMLAGTAVKPPQLDEFFMAGESALRADDFAELGFDEGELWGAPEVG